jgi:hypothetical protein
MTYKYGTVFDVTTGWGKEQLWAYAQAFAPYPDYHFLWND